MIKITKETLGKNGVEVIIFNGKKWLNEKHIETQLDYANLPAVTLKYSSEVQYSSILSKIVTLFSAEKIIPQYNVLSYRIDTYFPNYKLAVEIAEQGHNNRDFFP